MITIRIDRLFVLTLLLMITVASHGEDGSSLWLRQADGQQAAVKCKFKPSSTVQVAIGELQAHWQGAPVELRKDKRIARDGFTIASQGSTVSIAASTDAGLLYGAYHLLRMAATGASLTNISVNERPAYDLRVLNHWDNPNGTVERGFAGRSIFWGPDKVDDNRLVQYARANASVGINGAVLNNVNAKPQALSSESLAEVKHVADVLRPYGIKVYLSVNFASPIHLGNLKTADPLDAQVDAWWRKKADEIYRMIPDFGGFLVKANSEGEPGPCDYGRSHAEGANMLANALARHGGIVMWRAFVYDAKDSDRAKQAYKEFMPLDGQFRPNVILQVKNGPVDFQPREPYSPLFTSLQHTPTMVEFQVTQEYLGAANHLVFLAPMWQEFFSLVTPGRLKAIAGVANIGTDANWCGHHFAQANWYAFGRLAWNPALTSETIAREWLQQTFGSDSPVVQTMTPVLLQSHDAAVSYMMPLGLHHIFAGGHHYGPEPWYTVPGIRRDWTPAYYHQADSVGLGFDRTRRGSGAVEQYPDSLCRLYDDVNTCPDQYLLWFHHVAWDYRMSNGSILWDELCRRYDEGVRQTRRFLSAWDALQPFVDAERFDDTQRRLRIQARDAVWWRDACLLYFQTFSKRPIPQDVEHPVHNLDEMMRFKINITMYENPACGYDK